MNIPAAGVQRRYVNHKSRYDAATQRVLCSGRVLNGPETGNLCGDWKAESQLHTLPVNSGTGAISIALRAIRHEYPDRSPVVAIPALVPSAVPSAALSAGYEIVFVDVKHDCQIDPESLKEALHNTPDISVVIAVHMFGSQYDVARVAHVIAMHRNQGHGMTLIEDCSHAHGLYLGEDNTPIERMLPVGCTGEYAVFSCYPTKNLPAFGDAGLLCSTSIPRLKIARMISQYGWNGVSKTSDIQGSNYRMDELQAAYLRIGIDRLRGWNTRREEIAEHYFSEMSHDDVRHIFEGEHSVHHQYVLELIEPDQRNSVYFELQNRGVFCGIHYDPPAHKHPAFSKPAASRGVAAWRFLDHIKKSSFCLPMAERLASRVISLPCYPELTDNEVEYIVEAFNETIRSNVVHPWGSRVSG